MDERNGAEGPTTTPQPTNHLSTGNHTSDTSSVHGGKSTAETLLLHQQLCSDLHSRTNVPQTLQRLVEETEGGYFSESCLKGLFRELGVFLRPNNDSLVPIDDVTKSDSILVVAHLTEASPANRTLVEDSGILGTSMVDLLNHPNIIIQQYTAMLLHYMSRSQQISVRISKPWALNPIVSLFVTTDDIDILDHLVACFANLVPMDNLNIIGKQEVIDRIGYLLKNGTEQCKEHAAFFVCNYLARKDTVTHMIIRNGLPEILIDLLRHGIAEKGKKPILASLGMLAEVSQDICASVVKMGILGSVVDILYDRNASSLHELCLELAFTLANDHALNKMQILTAGFMAPLLELACAFRDDARLAQKSMRALAALSDSHMFPSIFGVPKLALFADVLRCGEPSMVQCSVLIMLNLAVADATFRSEIINLGLVQLVKDYVDRLGESKASNPVFQDFVAEMEKLPKVEHHQQNDGGWFSSVSNFLWSSGTNNIKQSTKLSLPSTPPEVWTVHEVCEWLKRYSYAQYTETFSKHLINGGLLLDLDDTDLQDLGITDKFHRRGILKQIGVLKGARDR